MTWTLGNRFARRSKAAELTQSSTHALQQVEIFRANVLRQQSEITVEVRQTQLLHREYQQSVHCGANRPQAPHPLPLPSTIGRRPCVANTSTITASGTAKQLHWFAPPRCGTCYQRTKSVTS
eukprot:5831317-Amphidinium_carterae.1